MPRRCELGVQNWLQVSLIKSCACQSVSSWISYFMIFLIEAKPEQISPRDQKPGCALFIIAQLLSQLRIFWKVSCLSGTAKHPATLTGFWVCKMRTRSWSVKSNLQETFPFYHPLLTAASSCSPRLPLPGMNSCSRMLRVIAVKLQRACFIKHILLLDFHWCSIILSFQHARHPFFIHLLSIRQVQGTPHVFVLAIWFSFTDTVQTRTSSRPDPTKHCF